MPQFAFPWFLLLLLLVPPLAWISAKRRRPAISFSDVSMFASIKPGRSRRVERVGALARVFGLVLLILALAGPRWPDRGSRVDTEGVALLVILDTSGSMGEPDFQWDGRPMSRLDAAKKVFRLFVAGGEEPTGQVLPGRRDDLVGLVTFARWPESACPLTLSHSALLQILDRQRPQTVPTEAQTNVGDAVAWGLHHLESASARRRVLVLLSDGEHNVPPPALTPRQAAQLAGNQHVPIYAIDCGGEPGEEPTMAAEPSKLATRRAGRAVLQAVAGLSGGRYFPAGDGEGLVRACTDIDALERARIESFLYTRYFEGAAWFGLGCFVLWGGVFFMERSFWLRLPRGET